MMETRLATQVKAAPTPPLRSPHTGLLQRLCACGGAPGIVGQCEDCSNKQLNVQRTPANQTEPSTVPPIVQEVLRSPGQPLGTETRAFMEPRFGHDFSHVQVHTDVRAAESARAVNALAYTVGRDVVFGTGQYAPGTTGGQRLIAHELTHVVQQRNALDRASSGLQLNPHDDITEAQANESAESILTAQQRGGDKFSTSDGFLQRQSDERKSGLNAPLFKGDHVLEECLAHLHTLMAGPDGKVGDRGEAVKKVQQALIDLGLKLPKYGVDGKFGPETKAAVEAFQRSQGFTGKDVDGKIGPRTMAALDASFESGKAVLPKSTAATDKSEKDTPSEEIPIQPTPTHLSESTGDTMAGTTNKESQANTGATSKEKTDFSISTGGGYEGELSKLNLWKLRKWNPLGSATITFQASIPFVRGQEENLWKWFNKFDVNLTGGFKLGDEKHDWFTPIATEATMKMINFERKSLPHKVKNLLKFEGDLSLKGGGEFLLQTKEPSYGFGGEIGGELEYRYKKNRNWVFFIGGKGTFMWQGREGGTIDWQGVKVGVGVGVKYNFKQD
jgi:peptidoglycan hydrolase-like protein with peptidoglycan-binding domain